MANTHRSIRGRSFPETVCEGDIEIATLIDHLSPERELGVSHRGGQETWACAWSPDGFYFAWSVGNCCIRLMPWNKYKHCRINLDPTDLYGRLLHVEAQTLRASDEVWSLAFGFRTPTNQRKERRNHGDGGRHLTAETEGLLLAVGAGTQIQIWAIKSGEVLFQLAHHKVTVRDLKFAPDGSPRLLAGSRDGTLSLWDLGGVRGRLLRSFQGVSLWVYSCAWSPCCDLICATGDHQMVMLWNIDTGSSFHLTGHRGNVSCCDFSPDGALLATSSFDSTVIIWDPYTQQRLRTLLHCYLSHAMTERYFGYFVRFLSFNKDSRYLVSVCEDRFVRFWDLLSPGLPPRVALVSNALCCAFSPDGEVLAVGTRNGAVTMWQAVQQVSSLQHLCRMAVRRVLPSTRVHRLRYPNKLKRYLTYLDVFPDAVKASHRPI